MRGFIARVSLRLSEEVAAFHVFVFTRSCNLTSSDRCYDQCAMWRLVLLVVCIPLDTMSSLSDVGALSDDGEVSVAGGGSMVQVGCLSDDEPGPTPLQRSVGVRKQGRRSMDRSVDREAMRKRLFGMVASKCQCSHASKTRRLSCFRHFVQKQDKVLDLQVRVASLHKLDSDQLAFRPLLGRFGLKPLSTFDKPPRTRCNALLPSCRSHLRSLASCKRASHIQGILKAFLGTRSARKLSAGCWELVKGALQSFARM